MGQQKQPLMPSYVETKPLGLPYGLNPYGFAATLYKTKGVMLVLFPTMWNKLALSIKSVPHSQKVFLYRLAVLKH